MTVPTSHVKLDFIYNLEHETFSRGSHDDFTRFFNPGGGRERLTIV